MNIKTLRADQIYQEVAQASPEEKLELFRNEMMAPFMKQWQIQQLPFKAEEANGFDVVTFNSIMHRSPDQITGQISSEIELISSDSFWSECEHAVKQKQTIMVALDEYVSGNDISNLQIFNSSSVLPLKEQYANEARFIYGETETYKEFNETLEKLSLDDKEERLQSMEEIFKQIASCVDQAPSSDEVQRLIEEWKKI